jgi:ATP-dependent Clp protease ATP-binding subunit ClpC
MRRAETEARRLGHPFVGTEHFLLGLLADLEPTLAAFFASVGVSVERVQDQTLRLIGAGGKG